MDVTLVLISRGSYKNIGPAVTTATKRGAAIAECYWDGETVALELK